ncbi:MAG: L-threonylcarbamoyladenylate synthase [Candidatus Nanopelagicales bacterium]
MSIESSTDANHAARVLLDSGLVILPTETVYGLAARADDEQAVARVYDTKGRPRGHPLIVHVADHVSAFTSAWVHEPTDLARSLAEAFWPGPLTLVLSRGSRAGDDITGGQPTVALRVPAHPLAQEVLQEMDRLDPIGAPHGIAAPSANRFGRVSPTTMQHALDDVGRFLRSPDLALDGGPTRWGVESTIIDARGADAVILRPGGVTAADLTARGITIATTTSHRESQVRVPGTLASHYAPTAAVIVVHGPDELARELDRVSQRNDQGRGGGFLALASTPTPPGLHRLANPDSPLDYAHDLYAALHDADARDLDFVIAFAPPVDDGVSAAVLDRLTRAASPRETKSNASGLS